MCSAWCLEIYAPLDSAEYEEVDADRCQLIGWFVRWEAEHVMGRRSDLCREHQMLELTYVLTPCRHRKGMGWFEILVELGYNGPEQNSSSEQPSRVVKVEWWMHHRWKYV